MVERLRTKKIAMHPLVKGEIAMGNFKARDAVLRGFEALPPVARATDGEVMHLIEKHKLFGRGIGFVDCHLLASARISGLKLWSKDKRLHSAAKELGIAAD
jgi:predicted nucleic acid-binding protein